MISKKELHKDTKGIEGITDYLCIYLRTVDQSEMREIGFITKVELLIEIFLVLKLICRAVGNGGGGPVWVGQKENLLPSMTFWLLLLLVPP